MGYSWIWGVIDVLLLFVNYCLLIDVGVYVKGVLFYSLRGIIFVFVWWFSILIVVGCWGRKGYVY